MNSSIEPGELNDIKRTIENVKKSLDEFCSPDMEDSPEITSKKILQTPSVANSQNFINPETDKENLASPRDNPCDDSESDADDAPMKETPDLTKKKWLSTIPNFEPSPTSNAALSTKRKLAEIDMNLIERLKNERLQER